MNVFLFSILTFGNVPLCTSTVFFRPPLVSSFLVGCPSCLFGMVRWQAGGCPCDLVLRDKGFFGIFRDCPIVDRLHNNIRQRFGMTARCRFIAVVMARERERERERESPAVVGRAPCGASPSARPVSDISAAQSVLDHGRCQSE